jgi:hypothetical protein
MHAVDSPTSLSFPSYTFLSLGTPKPKESERERERGKIERKR